MAYSQNQNYVALASVLVLAINKFFPGLGVTNDMVVTVIASVVGIYGVLKSIKAHKQLAIAAGIK